MGIFTGSAKVWMHIIHKLQFALQIKTCSWPAYYKRVCIIFETIWYLEQHDNGKHFKTHKMHVVKTWAKILQVWVHGSFISQTTVPQHWRQPLHTASVRDKRETNRQRHHVVVDFDDDARREFVRLSIRGVTHTEAQQDLHRVVRPSAMPRSTKQSYFTSTISTLFLFYSCELISVPVLRSLILLSVPIRVPL